MKQVWMVVICGVCVSVANMSQADLVDSISPNLRLPVEQPGATQNQIDPRTINDSIEEVRRIAPDASNIQTASTQSAVATEVVEVYDPTTGRLMQFIDIDGTVHDYSVQTSRKISITYPDGVKFTFHEETGALTNSSYPIGAKKSYNPDLGLTMNVTDQNGRTTIYDSRTGNIIQFIRPSNPEADSDRHVPGYKHTFDVHDRVIATSYANGFTQLRDPYTGEITQTILPAIQGF